jgi:hypothetical protein
MEILFHADGQEERFCAGLLRDHGMPGFGALRMNGD